MLIWGPPLPAVRSSEARRFPHQEQTEVARGYERQRHQRDGYHDDKLSYPLAIDVAHGSPGRKPALSHLASTARSTPGPLATPWCGFCRVNQPSGVAEGFPQGRIASNRILDYLRANPLNLCGSD